MSIKIPAGILVAAISVLPFSSVFAQAPCNPNTQVCRTNSTLKGSTPFRGAVGSARVEFYPVPLEKGSRKGVVLWVFGFGLPKAADKCLNAGDSSDAFAITDKAVWDPVRLGFDHYVVDFCDPTDYLQRNASVVERLISERIKPSLGSAEKFGIVGNSMGGLITRYVLTRFEAEGRAHGAHLWMTNDSPLKGAYIPLSIQLLGEVANSSSAFVNLDLRELEDVAGLADTPAARQMLLAHHQGFRLPGLRLPGGPHADHVEFFRELEAQGGGFPKSTGLRTVAIASGAGGSKATHPLSGVTWRYPVEKSVTIPAPYIEDFQIKWKTWFKLTYRGAVVVRLLPWTQPQQTVVRTGLEGQFLVNGVPAFPGGVDAQPVAQIVKFLVDLLKIKSDFEKEIVALVLPPVAEEMKKFDRALFGGLAAVSVADAAYAYEALPGGLNPDYPRLAEALKNFPGKTEGGAPGTFIPTFSALASTRAPNASQSGLTASETPFNRVVLQSRDRGHVLSETDVACQETRRLAGAPYIDSVSPPGRAAGQGSFTLEVLGGNFTAQSVVSFDGTKLPTAFVNSGRLSAEVSVNLIAQATTAPLWKDDPDSPRRPAIVSVNQYDAQGRLLASQHHADLANCIVGVVVQPSSIEFSPPRPTTEDTISVVYQGEWNDSCTPRTPQVSIAGRQITITATNPDSICFFALTPYELRVALGPFPPGEYQVMFRDVRGSRTTQLGQRSFAVTYPQPSITLLQPGTVTAGDPAFSLKVEGAQFVSGASTVYWNGQVRSTTFVDGGELAAQISAADIRSAGNAQVTVRTAANIISEAAVLPILKAPPSITSISPGIVVEDSGAVSLRINGTNFASNAVAVWLESAGAPEQLATSRVSATQLTVTVAASRLTTPGSYPIGVLSDGLTSAAEYLVVEAAVVPETPRATITGAGNGASFAAGVSRGAIASIFGTNLADREALADRVPLPRVLADAQVMVAGVAAPLFGVTPGQINFQVPFEAPLGAAVPIWVVRGGVAGPQSTILITENALGIFSYERAPGVRDPIITHADRTLVTPANPARPGEVVVVWATGVGTLDNPPSSGGAAPFDPPASSRVTPQAIVTGSSSGSPARVLFVGLSPGSVGLIQMNIELPSPRPPDASLSLGVLFPGQERYLLVPVPMAAN